MKDKALLQLTILLFVCTYLYTGIYTSFAQAKFEVWHGQEMEETEYPTVISVSDIQKESAQNDFEFTYLFPLLLCAVLIAGYAFERTRKYKRSVRSLVSILLIIALANVMFFAPHSFSGHDLPTAEAAVAIQSRNSSETDTDSLSHVVSLPSSIAAGDLIIVEISFSESQAQTLSATGYTEFGSPGTVNISINWFYRIADGTEGANVTFTSTATGRSAHRTWRITGHDSGTPPEHAGTGVAGSATDVDPPSLTPSWGPAENLWLVGATIHGRQVISAAPSNYTDLFTSDSGSSGDNATDVTLGAAERILNASSEDPGTFTSSKPSGRHWAASTVAIKPASALSTAVSETIRGGTVIRGGTIFR